MKTIKNLMLGIGLAGSLALGGCKDNQKYKDFAEFIKKEGKDNRLGIIKDNGESYFCRLEPENRILIVFRDGYSSEEFFKDENLDGLDGYGMAINYGDPNSIFPFPHESQKERFDSLIVNIPKWYKEAQ